MMNPRCGTCGKEISFDGNPFRPFCSERCKLLDLLRWMEGSYALPGEEEAGDVEHHTPGIEES